MNDVIAITAIDRVIARASADRIIAGAGEDQVIAIAAPDLIVTVPGQNDIIPGIASDLVIAHNPGQGVVAVQPAQDVTQQPSGQGIVSARASLASLLNLQVGQIDCAILDSHLPDPGHTCVAGQRIPKMRLICAISSFDVQGRARLFKVGRVLHIGSTVAHVREAIDHFGILITQIPDFDLIQVSGSRVAV